MVNYKKIYKQQEALVSDELINSSDTDITNTIPGATAGMVIYNAGQSTVKQMSLDGTWVPVATGGGGGADGKSAYELAKEQNPDVGSLDEWLASLKGATGAAGKAGASVTAITLKTDADGKVTGGTATLSDKSSINITVTTA